MNDLVNVIAGVILVRNEQNRHSPTLSVHGCFIVDAEYVQVVRTTTSPTACGSEKPNQRPMNELNKIALTGLARMRAQ